MNGRMRKTACLVGVAVALAALVACGFRWYGERRIAAALDRIRASGAPVTLDELEAFYEAAPGDPDSTQLWLEAFTAMRRANAGADFSKLTTSSIGPPHTKPGTERLSFEFTRNYLEKRSEARRLILEAAGYRARPRFEVEFDPLKPGLHPFPFQELREAARMMQTDASFHAFEGEFDNAADAVHGIFAAGRSLDGYPTIIAMLTRLALEAVAFGETDRLLDSEVSIDSLDLLGSDLAQIDYSRSLRTVFEGERAIAISLFERIELTGNFSGGWPTVMFATRGDYYHYLQTMEQLIAATNRPWPEALSQAKLLDPENSGQPDLTKLSDGLIYDMGKSIHPFGQTMFGATCKAVARQRIALAAIAAERYRRREGKLPDRLEALTPDFLEETPQDPFSGKPLDYRFENEQLIIGSPGPDGSYSNNVPDDDIEFTLPVRAHKAAR